MGTLYIVATPIGNVKDITLRVLEVLKSVDILVCEDTRVTKKLLKAYNIEAHLFSYHQHSSEKTMNKILEKLNEGKHLALVTDAGTPGISDPGGKLIAYVYEKNQDIDIKVIPGPSAVAAALSITGFPSDHFLFFGFLPHKKGRKKKIQQLVDSKVTTVLFESPHRIIKTLHELRDALPQGKKMMVARELTKKFETVYRGSPQAVLELVQHDTVLGEFVIVISQ